MADFGLEPAQRGETNAEFVRRLIREERKKRTALYRVNHFLRELWEAVCADWKSFWASVGRFMAKEIPPRKPEPVYSKNEGWPPLPRPIPPAPKPPPKPAEHFAEPKVADTVTVNGEEYHVTREMHVTRVPEEIAPIFTAAPEELGKVERPTYEIDARGSDPALVEQRFREALAKSEKHSLQGRTHVGTLYVNAETGEVKTVSEVAAERVAKEAEHTPDMHDCPDCGIPVVPKGISRDLHGKKRGELRKKARKGK